MCLTVVWNVICLRWMYCYWICVWWVFGCCVIVTCGLKDVLVDLVGDINYLFCWCVMDAGWFWLVLGCLCI